MQDQRKGTQGREVQRDWGKDNMGADEREDTQGREVDTMKGRAMWDLGGGQPRWLGPGASEAL